MDLLMKSYLFAWSFIVLPATVALAEPPPTQQFSEQPFIHLPAHEKALPDTLIPSSLDIHLLTSITATSEVIFPIERLYLNVNQALLLEIDNSPWFKLVNKLIHLAGRI